MAVVTFDDVQVGKEGGFTNIVGVVNSATAADTVDISSYLNGREVCDLSSFNVTDEAVIADSSLSSNVVTIGTGPSADKVAVVFKLI